MTTDTPKLGPPDIRIAGLSLWIHGRQFEDSHEYWDGNWLRVLAVCAADGARVEVSGAILHVRDLAAWLRELRECSKTLDGIAKLEPWERELSAEICLAHGRGTLSVKITPSPRNQAHRFAFPVDQSHLPSLLGQLECVLTRFPIRGER